MDASSKPDPNPNPNPDPDPDPNPNPNPNRVPHEVLPSHAERYAITLWYFDGEDRVRVRV